MSSLIVIMVLFPPIKCLSELEIQIFDHDQFVWQNELTKQSEIPINFQRGKFMQNFLSPHQQQEKTRRNVQEFDKQSSFHENNRERSNYGSYSNVLGKLIAMSSKFNQALLPVPLMQLPEYVNLGIIPIERK